MSPINDLSVEPIDQRLQVLKKRQRNIVIGLAVSIVLMVLTIAAFFLQKEFIYRFFDLSLHVQSLDLPYQVQDLVPFKQPVDYFFNLLSCSLWLPLIFYHPSFSLFKFHQVIFQFFPAKILSHQLFIHKDLIFFLQLFSPIIYHPSLKSVVFNHKLYFNQSFD